jgi:hypothetical protein
MASDAAAGTSGKDDTTRPGQVVGSIAELWRYPVKSMRGTMASRLTLTPDGSRGDRVLALRDLTTGRVASCKRFPDLLAFRAAWEPEPAGARLTRIRIDGPDGLRLYADDPAASERISEIIGRPLRLEAAAGADEKTEIGRKTVFGDVPVSQMMPDWTPETMPDHFQLRSGSFFEIGTVSLLATGSMQRLRRLQGGTVVIDRRRFRPNLLIDTGPDSDRFVEEEWVGGVLRIGTEVVLDEFAPILWCVTATLAQEDLPRDPSVLTTTAQQHGGCLGIYASVRVPGTIGVGDRVVLDG